MEYLQIIPLATLASYFLYLTYYYAAPMFWLRVLLLLAYKKHHCKEVVFSETSITVKYVKDGVECVLEEPIGVELDSRFFVSTACSVLSGILKTLRKERA